MPPSQPNKKDEENVFADFMSAFDPNRAPGRGVDHQPSTSAFFSGAFPFGGGWGSAWPAPPPPHPPHAPHGPHPNHPPHPPHPPHAAPPGAWESFNWWTGDDEGEHDSPHGGRWGRHGRRGRHGGRRGRHHHDDDGTRDHPMTVGSDNEADGVMVDDEKQQQQQQPQDTEDEKARGSPETMKDDIIPDPDEVLPEEDDSAPPPYGPGHHRCRRGGGRGGWRRGRGGNNSGSFGFGFGGRDGCNRCGPEAKPFEAFNFPNMMRGVTSHPFFQHMSNAANQYRAGMQPNNSNSNSNSNRAANANADDAASSFSPPVDTFLTETAYVLHVALPGARRDDIGVNWNPDAGELTVSGVVHRPGDEAFLQTLHGAAERRVGVFERRVTLPPPGVSERREDVDAGSITAKLEDGLLVVVVPKVEREWTEIRKVDIE